LLTFQAWTQTQNVEKKTDSDRYCSRQA